MNVVTLVGRLTADPNSRTVTVTGAERTVTTFGLAVPAAGDPATEPVYIFLDGHRTDESQYDTAMTATPEAVP